MNIKNIITDYIRSKWINERVIINEQEAREELLAGSTLHFFESGTSIQKTTFIDKDLHIPNVNPVIADCCGNFPYIYLDGEYGMRLDSADSFHIAWSDPASEIID